MTYKKYTCPVCKERRGVDIIYGMPMPELFEAAERGEVALGGCVLEENQPDRQCLKCSHEWQIKRRMSH